MIHGAPKIISFSIIIIGAVSIVKNELSRGLLEL